MKLACVIHRYGAGIAGGSEAHCRALAERLAARHDVTVLTTCARDYLTWRNAYPAGWSEAGGVRVGRFPVAHPRNLHRFADITELAFDSRASADEERQWFEENGPDSPELLRYLEAHGADYDLVLFWSYRYAHAFFGLPLVADRAILAPTAEEDPVIRFTTLGRFFTLPRGYLFLTPEEAELVGSRIDGSLPPSRIVGSGVEPAPPRDGREALHAVGIGPPFVLYLGRIDRNKGCETLLRYFTRFVEQTGSSAPLVMAGPAFIDIPRHPLIRPLGFVDEPTREALLSEARAIVIPSPYESLSLVLLEAWNHGVPALVNGRCRVLQGQVRRADGGLYYEHVNEFVEALTLLLDRPETARQLGRQGLAYVDREYRWPVVLQKVEGFLEEIGKR